jgi:putative transposase
MKVKSNLGAAKAWHSRGYLPHFDSPEVVHSWKSFTAHEINKLTGRSGPVWAVDYFDRFMRDEEHFHATVGYIEQNPVKARLVGSAEEWRFSSARRRVALEKP